VYDNPNHIDCEYIVKVRGIGSVTLGYVFTDYFAQGATWGKLAFFLHLLAEDTFYRAANLRVPVTRAASKEEVKLLAYLAPLWTTEEGRKAFHALLKKTLKPDRDYVSEMKRLRRLDEDTHIRFSQEWNDVQALLRRLKEAKEEERGED
jgi:hypothetical protein